MQYLIYYCADVAALALRTLLLICASSDDAARQLYALHIQLALAPDKVPGAGGGKKENNLLDILLSVLQNREEPVVLMGALVLLAAVRDEGKICSLLEQHVGGSLADVC
jgi:hypothetical protein